MKIKVKTHWKTAKVTINPRPRVIKQTKTKRLAKK